MPTPTVRTQPGRLDWAAYPGQARAIRLVGWDAGYLDGRTYELRIRGEADAVNGTIAGDELTFTGIIVPDEISARRWQIVDTSVDPEDVIIRGVLQISDTGSDQAATVEVDVLTTDEILVALEVTVLSGIGGAGATALDDLTDVDTTTSPPAEGDSLTYDAVNDKWVPGTPAGGGTVTDVTGTAPITSTGGDTPAIGITAASGAAAGSMSAANFTKLAGVETGATADQTAAEILAALLTVDGAGSGLDADLLDGQSSANYATAASVTAEAATRAAADTALDTRVDALEVAPPNHASRHADGGADELALDGSQITSGTVADGRIPSTITRDAEAALAYQPLSAVLTNTTASYTTADETKVDHLTVTQAVNLDTIETRVNSLDAAIVLRGSWDASAGTFPGGGTAQAGDSYVVSVAGTVGGIPFSTDDRIIALTDNASTSTYAGQWLKADYSDLVSSVNGSTGVVVLTATAIGSTATGDVAATNVQAAIAELASEKATTGSVSTVASDLAAHLALATDAHDASAISYAGGTGMSATTVEAAVDELATEKANTADLPALYQPVDSDLTAIALLTTTTFGRALLTLADAAAGRTALEVPTLVEGARIDAGGGVGTLTIDVDLTEGKAGGDTLVGGSAALDDLELQSTSDSARGDINIRDRVRVGLEDLNSTAGTPITLVDLAPSRLYVFDESVFNAGNQFRAINVAPTLEYRDASPLDGAGFLFRSAPVVRNQPGVAKTIFAFQTLRHEPIMRGDGALFTASAIGVFDGATVEIANGGTTAVDLAGFQSFPTVSTGATVGTRAGVVIQDPAGAGTITTNIGINVAAMTRGTTDVGITIAKADTYTLQLSDTGGTAPGGIWWGTDTNLYRSAADTLKTDDKLFVVGEVEIDGALNHDGTTVGLYGVTPVSRPSAYTQTFATADRTHAARTGGALTFAVGTSSGTLDDVSASHNQTILNNNFQDIVTAYNALRADLADTAALLNAVLDDLQAVGICQ